MKANSLLLRLGSASGILVIGLGLAACSSGVSLPPTVAGTDVPVSATTDSGAALLFVKQIVLDGEKNSDEPLQVGDVALAEADTQEPDESI